MKISPARLASFQVLNKIEIEKAFSSALLPIYEEKLLPKDRALCHELALGVLRNKIYLDSAIQSFSKTKITKLDIEVLNALRLGLYQIIFLDKIPAFSAINESVNLVQQAKKSSAKGFANAVLRRATREKIDLKFADEIEKLSVETSHPRWLLEKWIGEFGFEETTKLARINNQTPKLVFRLTPKSDAKTIEILQKLGVELSESKIVGSAWRVEKGNEMLFAYAKDGKIYFQEESSQLVAEIVISNLKTGGSFFDACAAPGSKFTQINKTNEKPQSLMTAGDFYEHRVRVMKRSGENQGFKSLNLAVYDAEKSLPFADETFDCVLLDAPCTGTGTIRHNPEIRYFLAENDFPELQKKQLKILMNASKVLKKGGALIYSTCSLEREENEEVIERFLSETPEYQTAKPDLNEKFLTGRGFARTFPPRDGTDGFFIAVLIKE